MILNATTKKLQVILGEAKTTTDCAVVADYYDSGTSPAGAAQTVLTNGVTAVDVVSSPTSGYTRIVNGMTVENDDTVSHTVTVRFYDNGTTYKIIKATLAPGYTLTFTKSYGWAVLSPTGLFVAGQIPGTATNDSAAAGMIGEYMENSTAIAAITSGVDKNQGQLSLTAGDWNVWGALLYGGNAATTVSYMIAGLSTTSATLTGTIGDEQRQFLGGTTPFATLSIHFLAPIKRFSFATTTTVYLVSEMGFAVNTATCAGIIKARRVR